LALRDGYYHSAAPHKETFDAFVYSAATRTAGIIQSTTSTIHSVKLGSFKWLQSLDVETFFYIAVTPLKEMLDIPFPNQWSDRSKGGPYIPEKYILEVEELPV